jgi:DNA-binding MarR family transcriptional regulator
MNQTDPFLLTLHEWISVFMRRSMHNVMRFSRESGWSMSQLGTLMTIHRKGTTAVSDIGDELGVSNAAASQMLDRLLHEGLILRTEDPNDRRAKQIKLTDKGCQTIHDSFEARHSWLNGLTEELSPIEKEQVSQALKILIERAGQFEQPIQKENK